MSAAAVRNRPASRPEQLRASAPPELRVVEGVEPQKSIIPMALVTLLILALAIVVPMLLNTRMAQTSFEIREHQIRLNELNASAWTMEEELQRKTSASALEAAAAAQGMVPAGRPGFIRLSTGTVEGGVAAR